jgi:hypothetical protein
MMDYTTSDSPLDHLTRADVLNKAQDADLIHGLGRLLELPGLLSVAPTPSDLCVQVTALGGAVHLRAQLGLELLMALEAAPFLL